MLHKRNFSIETAAENRSWTMEADTISKNGTSLKSHMIRGNKKQFAICFLVLFLMICGLSSCTVRKRVAVKPDYTSYFIGQNKLDIVKTLGLFDKEVPDGKDGTICTYNSWRNLQDNNTYFKQIPSDVKIAYVRDITFFFDKDDVCDKVITNATDIQRKFSAGRTVGAVWGAIGGIIIIALVASGG